MTSSIPKSVRIVSKLEMTKLALSVCDPTKLVLSKIATINKKLDWLINRNTNSQLLKNFF
jgi:hypothetical protein